MTTVPCQRDFCLRSSSRAKPVSRNGRESRKSNTKRTLMPSKRILSKFCSQSNVYQASSVCLVLIVLVPRTSVGLFYSNCSSGSRRLFWDEQFGLIVGYHQVQPIISHCTESQSLNRVLYYYSVSFDSSFWRTWLYCTHQVLNHLLHEIFFLPTLSESASRRWLVEQWLLQNVLHRQVAAPRFQAVL